jgi:hypothetical protein
MSSGPAADGDGVAHCARLSPRRPHRASRIRPRCEGSPSGGSPGQAKDEGDDIIFEGIGRGVAAARVGPGPSDELPVPAQQRRRRDKEGRPAPSGEQPCEGGEHGAIGRGVPRTCHLASQHRQLVAEHGDLDVLFVRCWPEPEQVDQAADEQEGERTDHRNDPDSCAAPLLRR